MCTITYLVCHSSHDRRFPWLVGGIPFSVQNTVVVRDLALAFQLSQIVSMLFMQGPRILHCFINHVNLWVVETFATTELSIHHI